METLTTLKTRRSCRAYKAEHVEEEKLNHMPKYRDRSRQFIRKKLLERIPTEILWPSVMNELFERDYTQLSAVENR